MILKLLAVLAAIIGYRYLNRFLENVIEEQGIARQVSHGRIFYLQKAIQLALFITLVILAGFILGFGYGQVTFVFTSAIALLGVALFAQWSVLSNVTASLIIFFFFPYRPGDRVRIMEADCPEGEIDEITLFHLIIQCDDGNQLTIPTTMVFQKAVVITTNNPNSGLIKEEKKEEKMEETKAPESTNPQKATAKPASGSSVAETAK